MKKLFILLGLALFIFTTDSTVFGRTFVTIGTGGVTGVYYPTGGAISRMVNKRSKEYGIKATVESTGGSVYNINAVLSGELEFGVAQSDRQYQAYNGLAEWSERGAQKDTGNNRTPRFGLNKLKSGTYGISSGMTRPGDHPVGMPFIDHHGTEKIQIDHNIPGIIQRYSLVFSQLVVRFHIFIKNR